MTLKRIVTVLLFAACLAVAVPAVAQSDPWKDLSQLSELSKLSSLSALGDIARLADLAALSALEEAGQQVDRAKIRQQIDREIRRMREELRRMSGARRSEALRGVDAAGIRREIDARLREMTSHMRQMAAARRQGRQADRGARRGPEKTERFSKTFRVGRNGSLDLGNISGDIVIKAGTGDDIVIEATKRAPEGADADRNLNAVTISATERGGHVEVRPVYPERANNIRTSVDFSVTVPASAAVYVHSISGDTDVSGVKGVLRLNTVSGDVRVVDAGQIEDVKSVSGDVAITGGAGTEIRASTLNGDLTVRNVRARAIEASTLSGEAKLTDVTFERAGVKTLSGDIDYVGPFARGGRYEFKAHSGNVHVTTASQTGFDIDANSFSGAIRCDLPFSAKGANMSGRQARRELKGTVGDGSAQLMVTTFTGDVTIARR